MFVWRLGIQAVIDVLQLFGVTEITVRSLSADNPVVGIIGEVDRTDSNNSLVFGIHTIGIARIAVANAMTIVTADTDAQTWYGVVV